MASPWRSPQAGGPRLLPLLCFLFLFCINSLVSFYSFAAKVSLVGEVIQEYVKRSEPGGALLVFLNDSRWWALLEVWGCRDDVGLVGTGRTCSRNGDMSRVGWGWEAEEGTWCRRNGRSTGVERAMAKGNVEVSLAWVKNSCERTGERSLERQVRTWLWEVLNARLRRLRWGKHGPWYYSDLCSFIHSLIHSVRHLLKC